HGKCAGLRPKFRKLDVRDSVTPRNPRGCRMYFCKLGIPHRDGTAWLTMQSACELGLHTKFPANREINREFCRIRPSTAIFVSDQDADSIAYNSLRNGTGNFQRRIRENFSKNREFPPRSSIQRPLRRMGFSVVTARPAVHEPDSSSNLKPIFCKPASAVFPYSFSISLAKLGA